MFLLNPSASIYIILVPPISPGREIGNHLNVLMVAKNATKCTLLTQLDPVLHLPYLFKVI